LNICSYTGCGRVPRQLAFASTTAPRSVPSSSGIRSMVAHISKKSRKAPPRRRPTQSRARHTVEAILDAVVEVLKRHGLDAVTTTRIAEVAGVSIGSVYQYFPDKGAIFRALHDRHVERVARSLEAALVDHAEASLEKQIAALLDALVAAHLPDPEL